MESQACYLLASRAALARYDWIRLSVVVEDDLDGWSAVGADVALALADPRALEAGLWLKLKFFRLLLVTRSSDLEPEEVAAAEADLMPDRPSERSRALWWSLFGVTFVFVVVVVVVVVVVGGKFVFAARWRGRGEAVVARKAKTHIIQDDYDYGNNPFSFRSRRTYLSIYIILV